MNKLFLRPIQHFFYANSMALRAALPFSTQSLTSAITPLKASAVPILENEEIIRRTHHLSNHELEVRKIMGRIYSYSSKVHWEKAEGIVLRMRESGIEPDPDIIYGLAYAYWHGEQKDKAVETLMEAISMSKPGWMPEDLLTVTYCFEYLESQGDDADAAKEKLYKMLKEHCGLPEEVCDDLKNCEPISNSYLKTPRFSLSRDNPYYYGRKNPKI